MCAGGAVPLAHINCATNHCVDIDRHDINVNRVDVSGNKVHVNAADHYINSVVIDINIDSQVMSFVSKN